MDKYVRLAVVAEMSEGIVMRCRHKETGQLVSIKKFSVTDDVHDVRRSALREIRTLRKLQHDNVVNMIEVFRRNRKFHLVYEYVNRTILHELEEHPKGLGVEVARIYMFQILRGIEYCHRNGIVHRNIKPETISVSSRGVIKLGGWGAARSVSVSCESYTADTGTRWYRTPELLVADSKYGRPVDVWAVGCVFSEILNGEPLFPGESEVDQLHLITSLLGELCARHLQLITTDLVSKRKNTLTLQKENKTTDPFKSLKKQFPSWSELTLDIVSSCLGLDPSQRATSVQLLHHSYFTHDNFSQDFLPEVRRKVQQEFGANPPLSKFYLQFVEPNIKAADSAVLDAPTTSIVEVPRWKLKISTGEDKTTHEEPQAFESSASFIKAKVFPSIRSTQTVINSISADNFTDQFRNSSRQQIDPSRDGSDLSEVGTYT